jgi:hypothetical protein
VVITTVIRIIISVITGMVFILIGGIIIANVVIGIIIVIAWRR